MQTIKDTNTKRADEPTCELNKTACQLASKTGNALLRQNYHTACEDALNEQINLELYASYVYLGMAYNFKRADIALKGFYKYFKEQSTEERDHASKLLDYQTLRGGSVMLKDIRAPLKVDFKTGTDALRAALQLERDVNSSLLSLHSLASDHKDPHLASFLEDNFLNEQVESLKSLADMITSLERTGDDYQFDKLSLCD